MSCCPLGEVVVSIGATGYEVATGTVGSHCCLRHGRVSWRKAVLYVAGPFDRPVRRRWCAATTRKLGDAALGVDVSEVTGHGLPPLRCCGLERIGPEPAVPEGR